MTAMVVTLAVAAIGFVGGLYVMGDWPTFPRTVQGRVEEAVAAVMAHVMVLGAPGLAVFGVVRLVMA